MQQCNTETQQWNATVQHWNATVQHLNAKEQHWNATVQYWNATVQHWNATLQHWHATVQQSCTLLETKWIQNMNSLYGTLRVLNDKRMQSALNIWRNAKSDIVNIFFILYLHRNYKYLLVNLHLFFAEIYGSIHCVIQIKDFVKIKKFTNFSFSLLFPELGTRSFFPGSLSALR